MLSKNADNLLVSRDIFLSPRHRSLIGECYWLLLYMIDAADQSTGIIYEWKDESSANDMKMPIRTLRDQRKKLHNLGYIICVQKQHKQQIIMRNWVDYYANSEETVLNTDYVYSEKYLPQKRKEAIEGFVYLVESIGVYKIGKSKKVTSRISRFETIFPADIALIHVFHTPDMVKSESDLHHKYRDRGEWFDLSKEQVAEICAIKDDEL